MIFQLGFTYCWSNFSVPIELALQCTRRETSLIFSLQSVCYSLGNLLGGWLNQRTRLRRMLLASAAAVSGGLLLTSLCSNLLFLFLSYGIIWGLGSGVMNNTVLSNGSKWFPDKPGFANGTMLAFFGVGSFVLGLIISFGLDQVGWRFLFFTFGILFGCISVTLSFLLNPPPSQADLANENDSDLPTDRMLRTRSFWFLFIWAALLMTGGMVALSNAAPIALSMGTGTALAGFLTSFLALANAFGRVGGGFLYDKLGYRRILWITDVLFFSSCITMAAALYLNSVIFLVITFLCMGITYGLTLMCSATFIRERYGARHYSVNLSVILTTAIPSSLLGPGAAGMIRTQTGSYHGILILMVLLSILSFPFSHFLIRTKSDQHQNPFGVKTL
ncbi:MFS transporter [Diplocloster hominis]|uniref:MFS transporter n=1 Tax=Diplocloster hominis TaxID=3079010 RepID=UPI0031B9C43C